MPRTRAELERQRLSSADPEENRATLVEHLEELRDRIIRCITILCIGWAIGWFVEKPLYGHLNQLVVDSITPVLPKGAVYKEVFHQTTEPFLLKLRLSFFIGLGIALPFMIGQLWGFIAPGLHPHERKPVTRLAPWTIVLFFMGAGFCWLILPNALSWFAEYIVEFPGVDLYQEAGSMVFFIIKMLLAFGIAFQLPLVVYLLGAIGLLSADTLIKYWRQASTVIFILAAILTPSNDPISMLMMAIPLVILFLISAWLVRITQRRKARIVQAEVGSEAGAEAEPSA